uniref:Uncharacterized protein n=1 Tax=Timema shepardi TaxID=629360 RepID=A0A7R9G5Q2_TIMSH|nr:unnamed protein product [Timema shepardi]
MASLVLTDSSQLTSDSQHLDEHEYNEQQRSTLGDNKENTARITGTAKPTSRVETRGRNDLTLTKHFPSVFPPSPPSSPRPVAGHPDKQSLETKTGIEPGCNLRLHNVS